MRMLIENEGGWDVSCILGLFSHTSQALARSGTFERSYSHSNRDLAVRDFTMEFVQVFGSASGLTAEMVSLMVVPKGKQ